MSASNKRAKADYNVVVQEAEERESNFFQLPNDITSKLLSYLHATEIIVLSMACKRLWRTLLHNVTVLHIYPDLFSYCNEFYSRSRKQLSRIISKLLSWTPNLTHLHIEHPHFDYTSPTFLNAASDKLRVLKLYFSAQNIQQIERFSQLEILHAPSALTTIDHTWPAVTTLKELYVSVGSDSTWIKSGVFTNLRRLKLIGSMPNHASFQSLEDLSIEGSMYSVMCLKEALLHLTHITRLELRSMNLVNTFWLTKLTSLLCLELRDCGLHNTDPLGVAVAPLTKLTRMLLQSDAYYWNGRSDCMVPETLVNLQSLHIRTMQFGHLPYLQHVGVSITRLVDLSLANSNFDSDAIIEILTRLPLLTSLDIRGMPNFTSTIANCICKLSTLQCLRMDAHKAYKAFSGHKLENIRKLVLNLDYADSEEENDDYDDVIYDELSCRTSWRYANFTEIFPNALIVHHSLTNSYRS